MKTILLIFVLSIQTFSFTLSGKVCGNSTHRAEIVLVNEDTFDSLTIPVSPTGYYIFPDVEKGNYFMFAQSRKLDPDVIYVPGLMYFKVVNNIYELNFFELGYVESCIKQ